MEAMRKQQILMPVETMLELSIPQYEMEWTPACQEAAKGIQNNHNDE